MDPKAAIGTGRCLRHGGTGIVVHPSTRTGDDAVLCAWAYTSRTTRRSIPFIGISKLTRVTVARWLTPHNEPSRPG